MNTHRASTSPYQWRYECRSKPAVRGKTSIIYMHVCDGLQRLCFIDTFWKGNSRHSKINAAMIVCRTEPQNSAQRKTNNPCYVNSNIPLPNFVCIIGLHGCRWCCANFQESSPVSSVAEYGGDASCQHSLGDLICKCKTLTLYESYIQKFNHQSGVHCHW